MKFINTTQNTAELFSRTLANRMLATYEAEMREHSEKVLKRLLEEGEAALKVELETETDGSLVVRFKPMDLLK